MRIPLSWLAEYTDLPAGATPDDVMAALVRVGLEEEGSQSLNVTGPLVVGEVLEFCRRAANEWQNYPVGARLELRLRV
jgi:phenylalanyl-tRNA synthetase beta chain